MGGKAVPSATLRFGCFDIIRFRTPLFASVKLRRKGAGTLSLRAAVASAPAFSFPAVSKYNEIYCSVDTIGILA